MLMLTVIKQDSHIDANINNDSYFHPKSFVTSLISLVRVKKNALGNNFDAVTCSRA